MKIRTIFAESWIGYIGELFKQYETVDIYRINIKSSDFFSDNNMTAIVGTINRRGVAFAADSAATHTISSRHKITNHANKIFELSN